MFSTRTDQENLTYDHQRAAAAKPLNQALGSKTPGNKAPKTPFRKQLNDENDAFNTGFKTGKKGGDGNLFTKGKKATGGLDTNAFITPAGPRNRAPLGMKTNNTKGQPLKTPAPKESAQKTVSPRMRRAKVKILHEGTERATEELAEPDIEYMPPRSNPLPDYPDDLHKEKWDMLRGANQTNGWYSTYMNPVGADGLTRLDREMAKMMKRADLQDQETVRKALANDPLDFENLAQYFDQPQPTSKPSASTAGTTTSMRRTAPLKRVPSSLSSKRAASALGKVSSATPSVSSSRSAVPVANIARTRAPLPAPRPGSAPLSRKPTSSATAPTAASMRHAAAATTSRSTLGYSKGRAVSASTKQPLSGVYNRPAPTSTSTVSVMSKPTFSGSRPTSSSVRPTTSSSTRSVSLSTKGVENSPAFARQKELLESLIAEDPEMETLMLERNGSVDTDAEMDGFVDGVGGMDLDDEVDELEDFQLVMDDSDDNVEVELESEAI